jgi:aspartyl-tRNA(Asn)/glutamyl-tRNA(Gln) amidotransferase subunit A
MTGKELCFLSAGDQGRLIQKKEVSPVEVTQAHLARIEALEPRLNSFITLLPEAALDAARTAEKEVLEGRWRGPLHGVPMGLKDLFYTRGVRTTSGAKVFDRFVPDFDSTVTARLKAAGAILLGKLNLHPLAYGPTGENAEYGNMHNPWDPERITGGSSGGSASAAASGECAITLGSDTGGSIRIPSSLCGLAGIKPTYGRASCYGVTALSWSLDHPGPLCRTAEDCALVMNAIAGYDPKDPASVDLPVPDYTRALTGEIQGLRIGIPRDYFDSPIDPEVKDLFWKAVASLEKLGARVSEVSWPLYSRCMAISTTVQMVEAAVYHWRLLKERGEDLYAPVRLRLETGFFISGADYVRAQQARALFFRETLKLFEGVDLLAGPTLPITAFKIGTVEMEVAGALTKVIPLLTQYTRPFNLTGLPAMSVPCGFSAKGLPVGLQLAGRPFDEETVLRTGHAFEQATAWHLRKPPLWES